MRCVLDCGAAAGEKSRGDAVAAIGIECSGATTVAPLSSKRRSSPRSNPANFDFTVFDMVITLCPSFIALQDALGTAGTLP
jgi:hypothetical protein